MRDDIARFMGYGLLWCWLRMVMGHNVDEI